MRAQKRALERRGVTMKICVYCSSSKSLNERYYRLGRGFGRSLARRGHDLVYGGYGSGIMGEVARGVEESGGKITAVIPDIFDSPQFLYGGCHDVVRTADLRERKAAMERLSDGFAVLPGGIGTLDELFEVRCLQILGELHKPLGILNAFGFYAPLAEMMEKCGEEGFLNYGGTPMRFFSDAPSLLSALEEAVAQSHR